MWGANVHKEEAGQPRRMLWRQRTSGSGAIVATAEAAVETKMEPVTGVKFAKQSVTPGDDELELLGAGEPLRESIPCGIGDPEDMNTAQLPL